MNISATCQQNRSL